MNALPVAALSGALMLTAAWGNSQRIEARALRAELDRTTSRAERAERQMSDMSDRLSELEGDWHTLSVVHQALDLSPPLPSAQPSAPLPTTGITGAVPHVASTPPVAVAPTPIPSPPADAAFLNINSIPPSTCLLDGKPIGKTPQLHVKVTPGAHKVQFVTPDVTVATAVIVATGEVKLVATRLPTIGARDVTVHKDEL